MMKNRLNPILLLGPIMIMAAFTFNPGKALAVHFNPLNPIDPFCLFSCHNNPDVQNTSYTNSNNVITNSNNTNSFNGSTVSTAGTGSGSAGTIYVQPTTPTVVNNNNNNNNIAPSTPVYYPTTPIYQPVPVYQPAPVYNYNYNPTPVYYPPTPVYSYNDGYYNNYNNYSNYSNNYYPLSVSCRANTTFAYVGSPIIWTASVSGGNSSYYTYSWSGSDSLYGYNNAITARYNSLGTKYANITVYANGQQASAQCYDTVTISAQNYAYNGGYTGVIYQTPIKAAPTKPITKVVTKTVYVKATPTPIPEQVVAVITPPPSSVTAASLFSLQNVPWGLVAILVILVLMAVIFYMIFNKKKI